MPPPGWRRALGGYAAPAVQLGWVGTGPPRAARHRQRQPACPARPRERSNVRRAWRTPGRRGHRPCPAPGRAQRSAADSSPANVLSAVGAGHHGPDFCCLGGARSRTPRSRAWGRHRDTGGSAPGGRETRPDARHARPGAGLPAGAAPSVAPPRAGAGEPASRGGTPGSGAGTPRPGLGHPAAGRRDKPRWDTTARRRDRPWGNLPLHRVRRHGFTTRGQRLLGTAACGNTSNDSIKTD
ncbi:hypothetical protein PAERUG_P18_London_17_VIM_2_04_10_04987 [Pseudomonas aeruginosa]|nr:hypothetical protein PAERUG_P18_London_17_VIM_2_04_10_04987 [Pseudomonas aeruginosa]